MTSILDTMFSSNEKCGRTKFSDRQTFLEQYPILDTEQDKGQTIYELPQETKLHAAPNS